MILRYFVSGLVVSLMSVSFGVCRRPTTGHHIAIPAIPAASASTCDARGSVMRTDGGFFPYVESPQVIPAGNKVFLIGSPAFAVDSMGTPLHSVGSAQATLLAGVVIEGTSIKELPAPTYESFMNTPRGAIAPDGSLNLVWMSASRQSGVSSMADSVIWSRWANLNWTKPVRLDNAPTLVAWNSAKVSSVAYHDGLPFFVATPGLDAPRDARKVEWTPAGWVSSAFSGTAFAYPSLLSIGDLQVVAFVNYAAPDGNALFARTSTDGGRSWGHSVRVSPSGTGEVHFPRILALDSGRIGLVWLGRTRNTARILFAISVDRGETWASQSSLDLPSDISSLQAVAADNGVVFVAFESSGGGQHHPALARWSEAQWQMKWLPAASPSLGTISIGMSDPRTVIAVWGAAPSSTQRFPRTVFARMATNCSLP